MLRPALPVIDYPSYVKNANYVAPRYAVSLIFLSHSPS